MPIKPIKLLTDNPLKIDNDEKKYFDLDGLKFDEYSQVVTSSAIYTQTPFTIGIFGEWGKGKTSFLEMVKYKVEKEEKLDEEMFVTVWFNAWKHEKDNDPVVALLSVINEALEKKKTSYEKTTGFIKDKFTSLISLTGNIILNSMNYKIKLGTKNINIQNQGDIKKAVNETKEKIDTVKSNDIVNKMLEDNSYIKIFEKLKELESELKEKKIRLFIFIDDLDRCLPSHAVELLENIKLVLDLKNFTFVLGIANDVIEGHLEHRYEHDFGIKNKKHGKAYLEKIIQLPFYLPKFSKKLERLVNSLFSKIENKDDITNITNVINSVSNHSQITPRFLVRLINQAKVHAEIDALLISDGKKYSGEDISNSSDYMFSVFAFILFLENLYDTEYNILKVERDSNFEILYELSKKYKEVDKIKDYEEKNKQIEEFKLTIKIDKDSNKDFDLVLKTYISSEIFRNILITNIAFAWLSSSSLRAKTFEFVDEKSNKTEDEIQQDEFLREENRTLDKIKDDVEKLEKDKNLDIKYDKFIEIPDTKYAFSKYLVTNKWYKEFDSTHNSGENFDHDFQPVVEVSYNDAIKFCKFLNDKDDKYIYSLPTKEQFEYVGSGRGENREYPWKGKYNNKFCNNDDIGLGKTSIVGAFSKDKSKDGIFDMGGNVWSWTSTKKDNGKYYLKGGSWINSDSSGFAVSDDFWDGAGVRDYDIGFFLTRTEVTS